MVCSTLVSWSDRCCCFWPVLCGHPGAGRSAPTARRPRWALIPSTDSLRAVHSRRRRVSRQCDIWWSAAAAVVAGLPMSTLVARAAVVRVGTAQQPALRSRPGRLTPLLSARAALARHAVAVPALPAATVGIRFSPRSRPRAVAAAVMSATMSGLQAVQVAAAGWIPAALAVRAHPGKAITVETAMQRAMVVRAAAAHRLVVAMRTRTIPVARVARVRATTSLAQQ